jgi:hypothetical protein
MTRPLPQSKWSRPLLPPATVPAVAAPADRPSSTPTLAAHGAAAHVPSALDERHAVHVARQERDEFHARYANRLKQLWGVHARRTLIRDMREWRVRACTPRELSLRARAFAQFHLLLRSLHTWSANGKTARARKQQAKVEQQQVKDSRLLQRALKFYKIKNTHRYVSTSHTKSHSSL